MVAVVVAAAVAVVHEVVVAAVAAAAAEQHEAVLVRVESHLRVTEQCSTHLRCHRGQAAARPPSWTHSSSSSCAALRS